MARTRPSDFFAVHQPVDVCIDSPQFMVVFLLSFWAVPGILHLLLGSTIVRKSFSLCKSESTATRNRFWVASVAGSFLFHLVVENLTATAILSRAEVHPRFTVLEWIWLIRPSPTIFITLLSFVDPRLFVESMLEVNMAEILLSLFTIRPFDDIRQSVPHEPQSSRGLGYLRMRDGSRFGVASWVGGFFALLLWVWLLVKNSDKRDTRHPFKYWQYFIIFSWIIAFARMVSSFVVWTAVPLLDPAAFCPSSSQLGSLLALSACVSLLDNLWRAALSRNAPDRLDTEKSVTALIIFQASLTKSDYSSDKSLVQPPQRSQRAMCKAESTSNIHLCTWIIHDVTSSSFNL